MKAKDAIVEIREWEGTDKEKVERLYELYKKEFNDRVQKRFHGSQPSESGLEGLGKEMSAWIDCIRLKGKFEWIKEPAGMVMFNIMYPRKEKKDRKPGPTLVDIHKIFVESVKDLGDRIQVNAKSMVEVPPQEVSVNVTVGEESQ